MKIFDEVDRKKELLDQKRPLPNHTVNSIRENLILEWTYHSNAIEGNTLTLSETKVVLEGITIGGKTLREHLEVINHREAIFFIEEIIKKNEPLSEWQIKNIHLLVLKGIDDENAGRYRNENVMISGAVHVPPEAIFVPEQMANLIKWYQQESQKLHPVERAALLHILLVKTHPFIDGNGRTARLLLNLELMKNSYPPVIIKNEHRVEYYNALDQAHNQEKYDDFLRIIVDALHRSFDLYLSLIK